MPYEPLHHKYRPQTFADLVGQEAIAATLINAIKLQKIAPAYLFTGPRGTGKTSSARILAKSLNCLASEVPTDVPCGQCEVCRSVAKGSSLDVIEIDAASNTGVDNIRELIERAQFSPVQCRRKVYIIDECHMLSVAAFNSLLKTLEEPPDHVVFVLATTDPQRVLPTIISRCQRFDFRRIPLESMVQHLKKIAENESIEIADDALTLVAQVAQGGLRDAESLLDQLSLIAGQVTVEKVWDLVGAVPERDLITLLQAIAENNAEAVLEQIRNILNRGREPLVLLQNLASFYRDLLIAKTAPSRHDLVAMTLPTWQQLCEFSKHWESSVILAGQKHLRESEVQLKNTTQPRLWLEVTLLGLLPAALTPPPVATYPAPASFNPPPSNPSPPPLNRHIPPIDSPLPPSETRTPVASPTPTPQPVSSPPAPPSPSPSTAPPTPENHDLANIWQAVLSRLHPPATLALIRQHCRLVDFSGNMARITISSKPLLKLAQSRIANVEEAFFKCFQQKVKVSIEIAGTAETTQTPPQISAPAHPPANTVSPASVPPSPDPPEPVSTPLPTPTPAPTPAPISPPKMETETFVPQALPAFDLDSAVQVLIRTFEGEVVELDFTQPVQAVDSVGSQWENSPEEQYGSEFSNTAYLEETDDTDETDFEDLLGF
jgi:DNA polymerase-3 subunit gamma/tau